MKRKHIYLYCILYTFLSFTNCTKREDAVYSPSYDYKATGSSAKDLLSSQSYSILKVDIKYMPGFALDPSVIVNLNTFLNNTIYKTGGIFISQQQITASGKASLTINEIIALEKNTRTSLTDVNQLVVHVLITDGAYSTPNVLGIAYYNTSLCLFGKTINDNSGGVGQASRVKLQTTVIEHEMGHLFGLVDLGSPMQTNHKDATNGNHCNNTNCLMYFKAETTDILGFLITGAIPTFDANCMADLKANGGK